MPTALRGHASAPMPTQSRGHGTQTHPFGVDALLRRGNEWPTMAAMHSRGRRWWPWLKGALAVAIVGGVGWQFSRLLAQPEVWELPWALRPAWFIASLVCY